ncbi:MAG: hypothetical protein ABJJ37_03565 [Roseibium sp.]
MLQPIDLTPDCLNCAALCCVVFPFDKSESFGIDKAAGEICANLSDKCECRIFEDRQQLGFRGCVAYNCYGAGQRVTQEIFSGRSWQDDAKLTHRMGDALSVLRRIHEQLLLLNSAKQLALTEPERHRLEELQLQLSPTVDWTEASLADFAIDDVISNVGQFLQGLKHHLPARVR